MRKMLKWTGFFLLTVLLSGCDVLGVQKDFNHYMLERDKVVEIENSILVRFESEFINEKSDEKAEDNLMELIDEYEKAIEQLSIVTVETEEFKKHKKLDVEAMEYGKKSLEYHLEYFRTGEQETLKKARETINLFTKASEDAEEALIKLAKDNFINLELVETK